MIRVAHFSDLHYGTRTLAEADRCFGAAIDRAIALRVDAAVIAGDATDHPLDLHAPAASRLIAQVRRLADHCPVLMLQGTYSHEPPGTLAVFRLLGGRHPVHVAERIAQVALTGRGKWVESKGWRFDAVPPDARALFTCVPTVNKAAVAAVVGAATAAQAVGEHLADLLRGYAPIHRAARAQGLSTIGVSHGTVFGCISEHGVPMAGFDHEFTTGALFGAEAQAFTLRGSQRSSALTPALGPRGVPHAATARALVATGGFAPGEVVRLAPAGAVAIPIAAIAAAAQDDLDAASSAQEQTGWTVQRHHQTEPVVLDGVVPARHTAVAPPSSARCRARRGHQAARRERAAAAPTFFGVGRLYRASRRSPQVAQQPTRVPLTRTDFARVCLAALQGGQADAFPHRSVARLAMRRDAPAWKLKSASSPSHSGGS